MAQSIDESIYLLIGGYTSSAPRGIITCTFNAQSGELARVNESTVVENPSFFCLDDTHQWLYAVSEGENSGEIHAFTFDGEAGTLTFVNHQLANGAAPCYVSIDKNRKHLFTANYKSGSLSVLLVDESGSVSAEIQMIADAGTGPNTDRQEGPHVHAALLSPDEDYLLYTDLGTDKIYSYKYQPAEQAPLSLHAGMEVKPGSGPRHMAFSLDGQYLYVVTELSAEVLVFAYNSGGLVHLQTVTMQADDFDGESGGGDIILSADGSFLYATNRGDANEIIVFAVNQADGLLSFVQRKSCMGTSPRNLTISPGNDHLLVANQESDNVVVFGLNPATGAIGDVISEMKTDQPSCLRFVMR